MIVSAVLAVLIAIGWHTGHWWPLAVVCGLWFAAWVICRDLEERREM